MHRNKIRHNHKHLQIIAAGSGQVRTTYRPPEKPQRQRICQNQPYTRSLSVHSEVYRLFLEKLGHQLHLEALNHQIVCCSGFKLSEGAIRTFDGRIGASRDQENLYILEILHY